METIEAVYCIVAEILLIPISRENNREKRSFGCKGAERECRWWVVGVFGFYGKRGESKKGEEREGRGERREVEGKEEQFE